MSHPTPTVPKRTGEPRQLFFLALCSIALVVAAFAAPPTAEGASPPDLPFGELFGNESEAPGDCKVVLSEQPVPGREVTVNVRRGGEPVEGVRVWFNDRSIGATNRSGEVAGTVPYVRNLDVTVRLPGGGSCEFETVTAGVRNGPSAAGSEPRTGRVSTVGAFVAPALADQSAAQADEGVNVTDTFTVPSVISVDVVGQADPGENVTVVATLQGDPVPGASVSVDGQRVGQTDRDGEYSLTVPDDGRERLTVTVQRGEIRGQTRVDVRLLRLSVRGEQFPLPGQSATVRAAIATDAVEGAAVTLDGERVGTTDELGETEITLPADPLASVTVTTGDRTARKSMLSVFAPTIVAGGSAVLLILGGPLVAYWVGGRRGIAVLAGLAANLITGVAGYAVAGREGAVLAVGSTLALLAVALFVHRPTLATDAGESTGRVLDSALARITDGVLWFTRGVEVFVDQTRSSVERTVDRFRALEPAALAADARSWLAGLPGTLVAGVRFFVRAPRRLFAWLRPDSTADEVSATDESSDSVPTASTPGPAIRELWRRFASRVVPDRWPQRTPGEVSRRAVEAGFPRDSVVELTAAFRDVEYGGEPLSNDRYERAQTAFDALGDGDATGNAEPTDGDHADDREAEGRADEAGDSVDASTDDGGVKRS